jgi:LysM repeat protein
MGADLNQEYIQVRKIALKDPKVQDAFEKANERLNERILEIDPALKPLVDKQSLPPQPAATKTANAHEHIVATGETLSSIAGRYHVTVAALKSANHIVDERKLRIGQKLVIPSTARPVQPTQPKPVQEANSDGNGGNWWTELKKNL